MQEKVGYELMIQIMSLKKDVDFVLKAAQDRIDELEIHRENAIKMGMEGLANKLGEYIELIRDVKTDFYTGVALNLERLATEIEAEEMKSVRYSNRELEELIKSNQRESAISAIKASPDFLEKMNNSFDENLGRIKDMDEKWKKRKS